MWEEPYRRLPRLRGSHGTGSFRGRESNGWWVGGEWIEAPHSHGILKGEHRSSQYPITIEDDEDNDCFPISPPRPQARQTYRESRKDAKGIAPLGRTVNARFDFNTSEQPLPWTTKPDVTTSSQPRSFADTADEELLAYLANRSISTGFLVEIDQFLRGHPEIADCLEGRETIVQLNVLSPLEAYKYFLRGYTRPARYIDGIVKSEYFTLPENYPYRPLRSRLDPELVDFFNGFEYRYDIIDRIDQVVYAVIRELSFGRPVSSGYRRLICYAIWGNPSDAYKWYEYSLQEEYLPHRYLPEHVVLGHITEVAGEVELRPSVIGSSRRHMEVRFRMARANDEGIGKR
ncbi:hypothetical protein N0V94_009123 [Neodidymelliopsis sp. IMI 364377]|nr:hypothetical protein N0V94_009123 [Neodidymelliopsis sp. IMI 364377]